jgi:hypothetical protein
MHAKIYRGLPCFYAAGMPKNDAGDGGSMAAIIELPIKFLAEPA